MKKLLIISIVLSLFSVIAFAQTSPLEDANRSPLGYIEIQLLNRGYDSKGLGLYADYNFDDRAITNLKFSFLFPLAKGVAVVGSYERFTSKYWITYLGETAGEETKVKFWSLGIRFYIENLLKSLK